MASCGGEVEVPGPCDGSLFHFNLLADDGITLCSLQAPWAPSKATSTAYFEMPGLVPSKAPGAISSLCDWAMIGVHK